MHLQQNKTPKPSYTTVCIGLLYVAVGAVTCALGHRCNKHFQTFIFYFPTFFYLSKKI